jgi:hypothetical protein
VVERDRRHAVEFFDPPRVGGLVCDADVEEAVCVWARVRNTADGL